MDEETITCVQALELIEMICGDDFCEDLSMLIRHGISSEVSVKLLEASEKLSSVYRISHSVNKKHTCYKRHDDWRREARDKFSVICQDVGKHGV